MEQYISKAAVVAKIEKTYNFHEKRGNIHDASICDVLYGLLHRINTLEVKEVDLIINTIIAECCDWLAMSTNLSHDEIEGCRNLMLTVKEEQFKAQKGEKA